MKKNKKKYIILLLLFIAVGMGIGYSLLQQQLKIQGTATVDDSFAVEITGIERYDYSLDGYSGFGSGSGNETQGTVAEVAKPTFTSTTANFNVRLGYMTSISYLVTIKNNGNLAVVLKDASKEITGNTNIEVTTPIDIDNTYLGIGETFQYIVKLEYKDSADLTEQSEKESNISITINAEQITSDTYKYAQPYLTISSDSTDGAHIDVINYPNTNDTNFYYSIDDGEYKELPKDGATEDEIFYSVGGETTSLLYKSYWIGRVGDSLNDGQIHEIKFKMKNSDGSTESNIVTYHYYYRTGD